MSTSPQVVAEIERIVLSEIDIEQQNEDRLTPLHQAARGRNENTLRALIELGANIEAKDKDEQTPLHQAVHFQRENTIRALIELGANIEAKDKTEKTPLHYAARTSRDNTLRLLIELGADIEAKDKDEHTPLNQAVQFDIENTIRALIELGANIETKDKYEQTPIHYAARSIRDNALRLLIELGADIEAKDKNGQTSLHQTAQSGNQNLIRTLVELGADIEAKDKNGQTPLHNVTRFGRENTLRLLIELGADIESKDRDERTPLHVAAQSDKENIIRILVELGADIEAKDRDEKTPLHNAARFGGENTLRVLIELGADIEAKDGDEKTPLYNAVRSYRENTLRLLIELGAEITEEMLIRSSGRIRDILETAPAMVKKKLEKCNQDLDSTRQSLDSCNTTISGVPGMRTEIQNLQSNLNSVREDLRVCRSTRSQVPEQVPRQSIPTTNSTNGTEFLNPNILDMEGFDTIFQMDTTVREFLNEEPGNFVIFEGDTPHLIMSESVKRFSEDGMVLGCFKVGYTSDTNVADELFNGNRLGTIYGYVPLSDLLEAISMVNQGRKIFKLGESTRTVPAVTGRNFFEAGGGMVSANHCQAGASGPVRNIIPVELRFDANVPESVNDITFITNAINIVTNRTTSGTFPIVNEITSTASDLGINAGDGLRFVVRWSDPPSNDMDENIEKLLSIFQPKINNLTIDHGHPSNGKSTISFIRDMVGLKEFSLLKGGGRKNGYGVRSVVTSVMKHKESLQTISLDEIDKKIPSFKDFSVLDRFTAYFTEDSFLGDILSHPSCSHVKLISRVSFSREPRIDAASGVKHLEIDFPDYTGSFSFLDKMTKLQTVKINAPLAQPISSSSHSFIWEIVAPTAPDAAPAPAAPAPAFFSAPAVAAIRNPAFRRPAPAQGHPLAEGGFTFGVAPQNRESNRERRRRLIRRS